MSEKLLDILKPKGDCIPEQMLIRYAEGKLSAAEARRVEEHISECEFCSDALDGIMQNGNVKDFHSQLSSIKKIVHKKVRRGEASETFPIMRTLGIAATLLLIAISAWYVQYVINNDSQRIFTHEFAPYPVPQIENNAQPLQPAVSESITESSAQKKSSPKIVAPIKAPISEEKDDETKTLAAPPVTQSETFDQESPVTMDDKKDLTSQEDLSTGKINADSTISFSNSGASYSYTAPSQSMTLNETQVVTSQEKKMKSMAKDNSQHEAMIGYLNNAMSLYQANRYAEAIAEFQLILQQEPNNPAANFYSGVSFLALKNADEALKYFKKTDYKTCQYYEATLWYESLSYISKDDKKQARKLLERVAELNGEYKMKAEETLKQL